MAKERIIHQGLPVSVSVDDVAQTGDRPNIVLIATDQYRADFMSGAGHPVVQTPHLDSLSSAGVRFEQAMSECPVCCPARRIMMTGRDSYGIEMYQNRDLQPFPQGPKLAECLSHGGYQTYAVGKMHTWPPRNRMGFDDIETNEEGRLAGHSYPDDYQQFLLDAGLGPQAHTHGMGNNQYGYRPSPLPEWATSTGWTADRSMRFLRRHDTSRPFFLYVSFDKPHPPLTPPAEYYDLYRDKSFPEPVKGDWVGSKFIGKLGGAKEWDRRSDVMQETMRAYAACITHIDARIGQIIGTLRETDLLRNTWILFISDHGDMMFDHQRRAKGTFLSGACQIPFILTPPQSAAGVFPEHAVGSINKQHPVGLQDLMPTICDLAGVSVPQDIPGRSVLSLLRDQAPEWRSCLCGNIGSLYAAHSGKYRYQWNGENEEELLFDLQQDPKNLRDLAECPEFADVKADLRAHLFAWMETHDDPHVEQGELVPVQQRKVGQTSKVGFTNGPWNNRGWRG